ncbi:MAG: T9SS type A sorting domain-containing protein [Sporocytophaga sp.]|nr:T9SS type A sorting domain-containing protein [Sporocytophaga sp.]
MISDSLSAYSFILENGKLNAAGKKIRLYEFISKNPNVRSINFLNTKAIIERFNVVGEKLTSDFSGSKITAQHVESYDYISISLDTVAVGPPSVFGTYTMGIYGTLKIKTVYYDKKGSALGFGNTNVTIDKLISNAEAISVRGKVLIKQSEFFNLRSLEIEDSDESIELDQTNLTGTDCGHYLTIFGKGKFIKKSGELNMNFVSIGGIEFTGGAVFKAYNSVDLGNNKGITISSASSATYYWIGGAGSWIDPLHWSLTSGGGPANCIPTALNDVIFDENSFTKDNEIIALGNNAVCRTIDLRGVQYSPVIKGYISIYGSLFLKKGTDISGVYRISFMSGSLNNRIDFAKTNFKNIIMFNCNGSYILDDSLQAMRFYFVSGTLNTNNKKVICSSSFEPESFEPGGARKLILGSSTLSVGSSLDLSQTATSPLSIDAGTSKVEFYGYGLNLGTNNIFNVVNIHSVANYINGSGVTIETLYLKKKSQLSGDKNTIKTLKLEAGQGIGLYGSFTQYIDNIVIVNPSCVHTEISGINGKAIISKPSGVLTLDHLVLKNITASGGATFNATNSIDQGGNSGWNIQSSQNIMFYWIGGNGNWSDKKKWSYTSGGKPANCVPSLLDDVIFDENSFYDFKQKVTIDGSASCKDMTWTSVRYYPEVKGSVININGSLILDSAMIFSINVNLNAISNSKLKTCGVRLASISLNAQKKIEFMDDVFAESVGMSSGNIVLNGNALYCTASLLIGTGNAVNVDISNSKIYAYNQLFVQNDSLTLNATNSDIYCYSGDLYFYFMVSRMQYEISENEIKTIEFNNIHFMNGSMFEGGDVRAYLFLESCVVNRITVDTLDYFEHSLVNSQVKEYYCESENLLLSGKNYLINKSVLLSYKVRFYNSAKFDYLKLDPGSSVTIKAGDSLIINDEFDAYGKPGFPIFISSETAGQQASVYKSTGTLCLDYLHIKDMKAAGGAKIFAGLNSTDISNNLGWDFTTNCNYFWTYADKPICNGGEIKLYSTMPEGQSVSWTGPDNFVSTLKDPVIYNAQPSKYGIYEAIYAGDKSLVYAGAKDISGLARIYESGNNLLAMGRRPDLSFSWYKDNVKLQDDTYAITKSGSGAYYLEIATPDGCTQKSNIFNIKPFVAPPVKPSNLEATAISSSQIQLLWVDNSSDESGFVIERLCTGSVDFEIIDTVFSGTIYIDDFLNAETEYTYRVYAFNTASHSDYVGPASAITDIVTGVENRKEKEFAVFPNPTQGNVQIKFNDAKNINLLRVFNDKGVIVYSKENLSSDNLQLDLSKAPVGIYMIQIISDGLINNEKLIVR